MKTVWVLTVAYNDYDQYGDYLLAVWHEKPTKEELEKLISMKEIVEHLLSNGGGRRGTEYEWFYLRECVPGIRYDSSK